LTGLLILDVSDSTNPTYVGYYNTPGEAVDVAVAGNYAFIADINRLGIYDVSQAIAPEDKTLNSGNSESSTVVGLPSLIRIYTSPNPFNPSTTITFNLPSAGEISLIVMTFMAGKWQH
jgi:hypothetical protein